MGKLKILQVCAVDLTVRSFLMPWVHALQAVGADVECACKDTGAFAGLRSRGLTMLDIEVVRRIEPVSNLRSLWRLYRLIKRNRYDIVQVHTPIAAMLGRLAARLAGCKRIVYTVHGFYFHEHMTPWKYKLIFWLEKWFARRCTDYMLFVSREDYELSVRHGFKPVERLFHAGNGVDTDGVFHPARIAPEATAALRSELGFGPDDVVFVFVGRLVREKGIMELVESFRRVQAERPQAKLLIVGELLESDRDREGGQWLSAQLQQPGIVKTGFRSDIPELLAAGDVFVLPSYREGLPVSVMEAMAMGKPVIATNIRGCREEVVPGVSGWLVEPRDAAGLAAKLRELTDDGQLRCRMGASGRERAERLFNQRLTLEQQLVYFQTFMKDA